MTRLQFNSYLRGLLGRGYSVADEEYGMDGALRLVVLRRGAARPLLVETPDPWIRQVLSPASGEDAMLLKHLSVCIRRYFANPECLPLPGFAWPGTAESRTRLRATLDPRKRRAVRPHGE